MNLRINTRVMKVTSLGAILSGFAASSHAALDTTITDSVAASQADMLEMGALIVGAAVAALGIRWLLRFT